MVRAPTVLPIESFIYLFFISIWQRLKTLLLLWFSGSCCFFSGHLLISDTVGFRWGATGSKLEDVVMETLLSSSILVDNLKMCVWWWTPGVFCHCHCCKWEQNTLSVLLNLNSKSKSTCWMYYQVHAKCTWFTLDAKEKRSKSIKRFLVHKKLQTSFGKDPDTVMCCCSSFALTTQPEEFPVQVPEVTWYCA